MATVGEVEMLESRLSVEDFIKMQSLFQSCNGSSDSVTMQREEFIDQFYSIIGHGSREEYECLFDSVDVSREGWVDWNRLASYLLMALSEKQEQATMSAVPRWYPPCLLPAPHRGQIQSLVDLDKGRYLSVSKEGMMAVWAENLTLLKSHKLHNDSVKPKDLWVTGAVVLKNVHKLAVSFTSKEICFYDLLSKKGFSCQYKVHSLHHTPICLHYWYDPERPEHAVLSFGDVAGQVNAICFRSAVISLFERPTTGVDQNAAINIRWSELQQNRHRSCYTVTHSEHASNWVRHVRFLGTLEAFVSCSGSAQSSMVLAWKETELCPLRITAFHTENGIMDLDYHPSLNLIATAGLTNLVCLWNPYLVSKPVGILRGHVTSVVAVQFMLAKKQLISFSKDKVLKVWDVSTHLCVQHVAGLFPKAQESNVLLFFHEERSHLFLSFNSTLFFLEVQKEDRKRALSHESAVTCVLYNSLFKQVISSDANSSVKIWLMDTGQKVKHFRRCHGDAEITAMALDASQTRLFTAGMDGAVKVWDFNGRCHHRLNACRDKAVDISQILVLKRTVLVFGWDRVITVFRMNSFSRFFVQPSEWKGGVQHSEHIKCAAFHAPQTLVTGGSDGELIVWNNSTENAVCKLYKKTQEQDSDRTLPTTPSTKNPTANFSKKDTDNYAVTRLAFLQGRKSVAAKGGADLVSCGGSGIVCFWNTANARLIGRFVAHEGSNSIILTVDASGCYLVTADMGGVLKVWDIQEYCLHPSESVINQAPKMLSSLNPHVDRITHLEVCVHSGRLFLLSASADCSLALSFLPGGTIGIFGQEVHWKLASISEAVVQREQEVSTEATAESGSETDLQDSQPKQSFQHAERSESSALTEQEKEQLHTLDDDSAEERSSRALSQHKESTQCQNKNSGCKPSTEMFSKFRVEKLGSFEELSKPDFIINPHLYFGKMRDSSSALPPPLPVTRENLKAPFDEKSLFPKEVLEQVNKRRNYTQKVTMIRNYGRAARSMGNLRELRLETAQLNQENNNMESRLQKLKETMSRRTVLFTGNLLTSKMGRRTKKESSIRSAWIAQRVPEPPPAKNGFSRKSRLKGKVCGQCEARAAGLVCAECAEDYCVSCFAKFHQKGALRFHHIIPMQAELHTSISTLDVVNRFQKKLENKQEEECWLIHGGELGTDPEPRATSTLPQRVCDDQMNSTQVLIVHDVDEEKKTSLLSGSFDEEESSRSFQKALNQWRAGNTHSDTEHHEPKQTAVQTARTGNIELMGTQAEERTHICIEFREHGLSYMERLLLKKHRRTQIESYQLPSNRTTTQDPVTDTCTESAETHETRELTDSDMSIDYDGMIPNDKDSSDEELKRCSLQLMKEKEERSTLAFSPSLLPTADITFRSQSPVIEEQSGFFTEPSLAVSSLSQRHNSVSTNYQGLDGFFTIGLDYRSVAFSPAQSNNSPEMQTHSSNPEALMSDVSCCAVLCTTNRKEQQNIYSAYLRLRFTADLCEIKNCEGVSTPVIQHVSHHLCASRPFSRAALEILEVQKVDQTEITDMKQDEEDLLTITCLEEEFKQISTEPDLFVADGFNDKSK
ncbi:WD repeat-containing protein 49 [Bagarius yarrelli]|uniref:WD repeat-containing protein 49 n=1 Tax=Bagarius yarrelli TaxID=175774 RepID=A0A556V1X4_BAGYA|nr:WD repeat-containing protein 49 [Bagarius yarrelli]